jgi:hypothetical protein
MNIKQKPNTVMYVKEKNRRDEDEKGRRIKVSERKAAGNR